MNHLGLLIISVICLSSCMTEHRLIQLTPHALQIAQGQVLLIRLNEGEVQVGGSEDEQIQVNSQAFLPEKVIYEVVETKDQIQITVHYDGRKSSEIPILLQLSVPNHVKVKIETEYASIVVQDYEGDLEAVSVAGDISIQNVNGSIAARSNRGDVTVKRSVGKISVVGNYGLLSFEDVSGNTGVSTIMGTVIFSGPIKADDIVHLETDHGPVRVNFSSDSAFSVQVRSTSGDVTCVLPGINSSLRACDGVFGSIGGTLNVRTVSGAVNLQVTP